MSPDLRSCDGGGIGGGRRSNVVVSATDFGCAGPTSYAHMNARLSDMGSSRSGLSAQPADGATVNPAEEPTPSGAAASAVAAAAAGGGGGGISMDDMLTITWSLHEGVSTPIGRLSRYPSLDSVFNFPPETGEENFTVSPPFLTRRPSFSDIYALLESLPTNCDPPPNAGTSTTVQDIFAEETRGGLVDQMIRETTRKRSAELGRNLKAMNYPGQDTATHSEKSSSRLTAPLKKSLEERRNKAAAAAEMNKSTESSLLGQHQQEGCAPGANGSSQSGQPQQEEVVDPDLTPPLQSGGRSERGNPSVSSQVRRASVSVQPSQPRPCPLHGKQPSHKDSASANRARREKRNNSEAGAKQLSDHNHLPGWMATEKDFPTTSGQMASGANEIRGGSNGSSDMMGGVIAGVPESFSITFCSTRNGSAVPSRAQAARSGKHTNSEMSIDHDDSTVPPKRCNYDHGTSSGSVKGRHCKRNPTGPAGENSATKHRCAQHADRHSRKGQATCSECSRPLDEKLQELQDTIEVLTEQIQRKDSMIRFLEKKSAEQADMIKSQHLAISGLCRVNDYNTEINTRLQERVENLGGSAEVW